MAYQPRPIDTRDIDLTPELSELTEKLARNVHEQWAFHRLQEGWTLGPDRDDRNKRTPCLVPYEELPEIEKDYDRFTAMETIKALLKMGYEIRKSE